MDNTTSNLAYWVLGVVIVLAVLFAAWWWAGGTDAGIPNTGNGTTVPTTQTTTM